MIDKYVIISCVYNQAMSNRSCSSRAGGSDALQQTKCSACNRDLAGSSKKCRKCKRYVLINKHDKQLNIIYHLFFNIQKSYLPG